MEIKLPIALEALINHLSRLPGVGKRTAQRMATELLRWKDNDLSAFSDCLAHLHERVKSCPVCGNYTDDGPCVICANPLRNPAQICVVENPAQIAIFERTGCYNGLYHVLGGKFAPLSGVGPEQLRCAQLQERLKDGQIKELILATSADVEGEATAHFLADMFQESGIAITRLAIGIPAGADLSYTDSPSLAQAFSGRRKL